MNNINIKNIFDHNYNFTKSSNMVVDNNASITESDSYNQKNFSVKNLTPNSNSKSKLTDEFIINKIKYNEENEKKKLLELYDNKYNESLIKINNAIDIGITDIFFSVPDAFFGYKFYNPTDCLEYTQTKLRNKNFDTLIINNSTLFISWKNLILFNGFKNYNK